MVLSDATFDITGNDTKRLGDRRNKQLHTTNCVVTLVTSAMRWIAQLCNSVNNWEPLLLVGPSKPFQSFICYILSTQRSYQPDCEYISFLRFNFRKRSALSFRLCSMKRS